MSKSKMKLINQKEITVPSYIKYKSDAIQIYYRRTKSTKGYWLKYSRNGVFDILINLSINGFDRNKSALEVILDVLQKQCSIYYNAPDSDVISFAPDNKPYTLQEAQCDRLEKIIIYGRIIDVIANGKVVDPLATPVTKE